MKLFHICIIALGFATVVHGQGKIALDSKKTVVAVLPLDAVALTSRQGVNVTVIVTDSSVTRDESAPALFDNQEAITAFAEAATQKVTNAFVKVKRITVVERTTLDRVLKEQDFQMSDFSTPDQSTHIGELLGAEYVMQGQLQQVSVSEVENRDVWGELKKEPAFTATVELNLRLINVATGEITTSKDVGGRTGFLSQPTASQAAYWALNRAEDNIADWLRRVFPVEGFILEIRKQKKDEAREVVITCGKELGVRKNDVFNVFVEKEIEIDGVTRKRTTDIGKLKVKKTEQDGYFSRCKVEKGGRDIVTYLSAGTKLKVIQVKK